MSPHPHERLFSETRSRFTCNGLSAAEYPHVSIISDEHELAADAHVHAAQNHDGPRQHAPQHQEEECSAIQTTLSHY